MRATDFRRFFQGAAFAAIFGLAGMTMPSVVTAQTVGDAAAAQAERVDNEFDDRGDGMDWGWLGLLGLAGLLGLRRRDHDHTHRVDHTDTSRRL